MNGNGTETDGQTDVKVEIVIQIVYDTQDTILHKSWIIPDAMVELLKVKNVSFWVSTLYARCPPSCQNKLLPYASATVQISLQPCKFFLAIFYFAVYTDQRLTTPPSLIFDTKQFLQPVTDSLTACISHIARLL